MPRAVLIVPLALLAACNSETPRENEMVTLESGASGTGTMAASAGGATQQASAAVQAVDSEGSRLEPLLSSTISEAGLDTGACRFSPARGALPVLVVGRTGGRAFVSVASRTIEVSPSGPVAQTGASLSGEGVTLMISASGKDAGGSIASMQVNDGDGPAYVYQDGFWACN